VRIRDPHSATERVVLTICHRQYALNVLTGNMAVTAVLGHTAPCSEHVLPTEAEARTALAGHLKEKGYAVDAIPRQ